MAIELKLIGFGNERPAAFNGADRLSLELATPTSPQAVLHAVGLDHEAGLVLMDRDQVIPVENWGDAMINDGQHLTLLSAFEGG